MGNSQYLFANSAKINIPLAENRFKLSEKNGCNFFAAVRTNRLYGVGFNSFNHFISPFN